MQRTITRTIATTRPRIDRGFTLRAVFVLPLMVAAGLVGLLFPNSDGGYVHYEGMGELPTNYKSWDEMSRTEREDSTVRLLK